jgi:beta-phosphoglucomutase family hydrolase
LPVLGLPDGITTCLFDLDGVITQTATVHAQAWKQTFDELLQRRARERDEPLVPFDLHDDYDRFVDGKPREAGVRDFLASRDIHLPEGGAEDPPEAETVRGVGRRKNDLVLALIERDGVQVYDGSVRYVRAAADAGLHRAVVSSSTNAIPVLRSAGLLDLFELVVDGHVARRERLRGKPAPDTFVHAAAHFGTEPARAAVFEDALAGVEAGRAGPFGAVVGVDRTGQAGALREHGAGIVVSDLAELLVDGR